MRAKSLKGIFPGQLCLLLVFIVTSTASAQLKSSKQAVRELPSSADGLPASCKSAARSPAEVSAVQALGSEPSAETYRKVGTLFGQAGNFPCAVAAFESALSLDQGDIATRYELGVALLENHQPGPAADQLQAVVRARPDWFLAHNALGLAFQDLDRPTQSEAEFKAALGINPEFSLGFYDLAQLLSSQKKYLASIYFLKKALSNSPSPGLAVQVEVALAAAYGQFGDYAHSVPLLEQAVAAQPSSPEFHFDLATAYAHLEKYTEAVTEYQAVLRLDPAQNAAKLWLAKALLNQSKVKESIPYLKDYVAANPSDPEGQEALGEALKDSEHSSEAVEVLRRAVHMMPNSYKVHYDLAAVLENSNQNDEAIQELRRAIQLKPDDPQPHYRLGRLLLRKDQAGAREQFEIFEHLRQEADQEAQAGSLSRQANEFLQRGQLQQALVAGSKALLLEPKDARLHFNLALALGKTQDVAREERELRTAIRLNPKFEQAHNELGSLLMLEGRLADAEREYKAAIDINPQYVEALNNLGTLYGRQKKNADAARLFGEALQDDPEYMQAMVNLGMTLAAEGNYQEAKRHFQDVLGRDPSNANALTGLGMLEGKTGDHREAVQTFRKLTNLYPDSSEAHLNLGIALGDIYDLQGALAEFSEAARLEPRSALAYYNKGRVLYALDQIDEARQNLEASVRLSPNYVDALFLLAVVERSSPEATRLFARVVALQPNNSQARFYLGKRLLEEGRENDAIAQWKKAVEMDPDNLSALSSLVRRLGRSGSPESEKYLSQLRALEQRRQLTDQVKQLSNFALQAATNSDWLEAVSQMQQAIQLCGQCAELAVLRKNIGLIYARKGDVQNARTQLQLALKLLPEGPDAILVAETLRNLTSRPTLPPAH